MNQDTKKPLVIWRIIDGKLGHQKQTQALLEGIEKQYPINTFDIPLIHNQFTYSLCWLLNQGLSNSPKLIPDMVIGAGHKTHIILLIVKRKYPNTKTILIMKPSLPSDWFDYIIAPRHDFININKPKNVITSTTALAPTIKSTPDLKKGLILLGGESKHFLWDNNHIINEVKRIITTSSNIHWFLTDSRRTPRITTSLLKDQLETHKNISIFSHDQLDKNWLSNEFRTTGSICVTQDSASMIAEALNTEAAVALISLETKNHNKMISMIDSLVESKYIHPHYSPEARPHNDQPLNQHYQCAKEILTGFI